MISKSPRFANALFAVLSSAFTVIAQQPADKTQTKPAATSDARDAKVGTSSLLPVVLGQGTPGTITRWTGNGLLISTIGRTLLHGP